MSSVCHGSIITTLRGEPVGVVIGNETGLPFDVYGEKLWIGVAFAAYRFNKKMWGLSDFVIPCLELTNFKPTLSTNNHSCDSGKGEYVSCATREKDMDMCCCGEENMQSSNVKTHHILSMYARAAAASAARSVKSQFGAFSLPRMEVLMRIYKMRSVIDKLDPTVDFFPEMALSNWGFCEGLSGRVKKKWWPFSERVSEKSQACVWSSSVNVRYPTMSGCISDDGCVHFRRRWNAFGVIPAIELYVHSEPDAPCSTM